MDFNPAYVDVALEVEAERLGVPPGVTARAVFGQCSRYSDVVELIPETKWREIAETKKIKKAENARLIKWVCNQLNEGSCVGNMWAQKNMYLQARFFGLENVVRVSPISAYKQIGWSSNSGANIFDALKQGSLVGLLPLDTPENRTRFGNHVMPATGFRNPFPDGWNGTAKHFRFDEQYRIRDRKEGFTALLKGDVIGVGRAGHSILYVDLVWDDANNRWIVIYINSWGEWGFKFANLPYGFGADTSRLFDQALDDAFVVRTPRLPPWEWERMQAGGVLAL
jgi:hypothetical protein